MHIATGDTFWAMLQARVALTPDRTMLIDEHGRTVTWVEFSRWVERVAAGLTELGIGRGSAVSWQLPTRMETIVLSMALARLGAVQNPIIHLYRQREVASLLRATQAELFVTPGVWRGFDYAAMAAAIIVLMSGGAVSIMVGIWCLLVLNDPKVKIGFVYKSEGQA